MSELAIRVQHLGKQYRIGRISKKNRTLRKAVSKGVSDSLRSARCFPGGASTASYTLDREETIWALRDVSFEIKAGEIVTAAMSAQQPAVQGTRGRCLLGG
jgi:lipopolysaccharide transport system ATP-binding protein